MNAFTFPSLRYNLILAEKKNSKLFKFVPPPPLPIDVWDSQENIFKGYFTHSWPASDFAMRAISIAILPR